MLRRSSSILRSNSSILRSNSSILRNNSSILRNSSSILRSRNMLLHSRHILSSSITASLSSMDVSRFVPAFSMAVRTRRNATRPSFARPCKLKLVPTIVWLGVGAASLTL